MVFHCFQSFLIDVVYIIKSGHTLNFDKLHMKSGHPSFIGTALDACIQVQWQCSQGFRKVQGRDLQLLDMQYQEQARLQYSLLVSWYSVSSDACSHLLDDTFPSPIDTPGSGS